MERNAQPLFRLVREERSSTRVPLYSHPDWSTRFPWIAQGTTGRGTDQFDLSFFGETASGVIMSRWRQIRDQLGFAAVVHARQVHGATVQYHKHAHTGTNIGEDADGHVTASAGALLAVSVADCVPIFLVDAELRSLALLHAGWRGAAAGMLERGVQILLERGSATANLHCHFGPAICGKCYEVGGEVRQALGMGRAEQKSCINLRGLLADRAEGLGIPAAQITISAWCTRCDNEQFFSHRAGDRGRQMGVLGIRPA